MASQRFIARASEDYRRTHAALAAATGEDADTLREHLQRIHRALDLALCGESDRECRWASGYTPGRRRDGQPIIRM